MRNPESISKPLKVSRESHKWHRIPPAGAGGLSRAARRELTAAFSQLCGSLIQLDATEAWLDFGPLTNYSDLLRTGED